MGKVPTVSRDKTVVVLVPNSFEPGDAEVPAVWKGEGEGIPVLVAVIVLPPGSGHVECEALVRFKRVAEGHFRVASIRMGSLWFFPPLVRFVTYDASAFSSSELFLPIGIQEEPLDHFQSLAFLLRNSTENLSIPFSLFQPFLSGASAVFSFLYLLLFRFSFVLKFSTLGLHLTNHVRTCLWAVDTIRKEGRVSLWTGNFLLALIADVIFGYYTLNALIASWTTQEIFHAVSSSTEIIIEKISYTIDYLMGSPAGLKLNYPLNHCLGYFFQYNIYLWWTFLGLVRPILEMCFHVFLKIGLFGLTFQIAVIADVFSIVSFHVYCIYVYAARLYELQLSGILSLSRLILGKERNPEPGKVDSCPYTTEQLILGTISFTVLLFLLPTTLVYYIVFTTMRLGVNGVGGIITRARFILQALPLYSTLMWLLQPQYTARTVRLSVKESDGNVKFFAELVPDSWWETTRRCVPVTISRPLNVQWKQILMNVATGKLIYPL